MKDTADKGDCMKMPRQFSPLLQVREDKCRRVIAESSDRGAREQARAELLMYERYRGTASDA